MEPHGIKDHRTMGKELTFIPPPPSPKSVQFVDQTPRGEELLQTIAAYFRVHFGRLDKLQGKAATPTKKLKWWNILMVDCVSILH